MNFYPYLLIIGLLCSSLSVWAQTNNKKEALRIAQEEGKSILLVFSGSDWCNNCMRLDKEVLQQSSFQAFAKEELVVLHCDFPQRKRLEKAVVQQNEAIAEQYNPEGAFPKVLLLDAAFEPIHEIKYRRQTADQFLQKVQEYLPQKVEPKEFRKRVPLMGSFFEFVIVSTDEKAAWTAINTCIAEAKRIEQLISEWQPTSEISRVNQAAGKDTVVVSEEVYGLIERGKALGDLTQGAFDMSFLAYYDYWDFSQSTVAFLDSNRVDSLQRLVDYTKIQLLDSNQVFLPEGMKIGTGGIGQGYAVDKIKALLLGKGFKNFVINSSGDVYARGQRADKTSWRVGVASPLDRDKIVKWLPVENLAVVTSGTSEKNFEYEGKTYGHIINPRTGFPIQGIQSATVLSSHTEIADALATAVLVLGTKVGLHLINQLPDTECIIIDKEQKTHYSDGLQEQK